MTSTHETISIVIPCFNHGNTLTRCINSVLEQDSSPYEVIVVDDGSTDQTRAIAASLGDKIRYVFQTNQGLSSARNAGLLAAKGDWILFLDADDALGPGTLNAYRDCFVREPADLYYGTFQNLDCNGELINQVDAIPFTELPLNRLLRGNSMAVHSVLVRKEAVMDAGGFDCSLASHEDWYLWLRLAEKGYRFQPTPNALALYYRGNPESMSRNYRRMLSTGLEVIDRIERSCSQHFLLTRDIEAGRRNMRSNCFGAILLPALLHQLGKGHVLSASLLFLRECFLDPRLLSVVATHLQKYLVRNTKRILKLG